jgi:glutamate/tyrosine decarboxylase-like PLP-dependent enzyme
VISAGHTTDHRLTLDPEVTRQLGYRAVDAFVERLERLPELPVGEPAGREEMELRLREPLPAHGCDPELVLDTVLRDVLSCGLRLDHPRCFAFIPPTGNPVGVLADVLAAGFNVFAGTWRASPGAAMIETVVVDWLRAICELPASTEGLFVSGGSAANLTALTVATGAVDLLEELRAICDEQRLWLHVDGAHGAAAMLSPRGRAQLHGLELADSLTLDPHKWLFQPLEAGCLLVRDGAALERTFSVTAPFLREAAADASEVNFIDRGIQQTRQFRALKLWMSLKVHGAAAFRAAIEHGIALAEHAERRLAHDLAWEVMTPARLGIVTFRARRAGASPAELDALNARLPAAALADGFAYLSSHHVHGATALRLCTINPRTTRADIDRTIDRLATLAQGAHA